MNQYQKKYMQSEKGKLRTKKYKDDNKEKTKAQRRAYYVNAEPQTCSIKGCDSIGERHHPDYKLKEEIIWLCRKHHLIIHGRIRGKCNVCDSPHYGKDLCKPHYMKKFWPKKKVLHIGMENLCFY